MSHKIPMGISSCLLGEAVRYNGGHKHSHFCTDDLSEFVEFTAYCPEVAIGLGVPREPIRLVGDFERPRVVGTVHRDMDVTDKLTQYALAVADNAAELCGYIFMKDSPSCGLFSAKVYTEKGVHPKKTAGVFSKVLRERFPLMPMEEAGRLNDARLRENFIARAYVYFHWRTEMADDPAAAKLVAFHSRHKYFAMSYSQVLYKTLGQIVAAAGTGNIQTRTNDYIHALMTGTQRPPTKKGHANVLFHLVGYLREAVPGGVRQDLTAAIEDYRNNIVPLAVPMKLMTHYIENYASDYIKSQTYLNPYPYKLGLRNAI